jgi:D-xylose reductase
MQPHHEARKLRMTTASTPPSIGLGLWKIPKPQTAALVREAIQVGYRHLDSACDYGNEKETGEGIRKALADGLCRRDDLWVTSKLWNTYHKAEHVRPALERTLADMSLDHLDLFLIHFPIPLAFVPFETRYPPGWTFDPSVPKPFMKAAPVPVIETWQAMERLVAAGLVRHIGVSNFCVSLLRDLLSQARIRPVANQVEAHPYLAQEKLLRFCREEGVAVTAFSPLGAPSYVPLGMAKPEDSALLEPCVLAAAGRLGKTPAQVVLRWAVQRGTSAEPKTEKPARLAENLAVGNFELSDAEMGAISALDRNRRFNDPGVFCEQAFGTFFPIYE